MKTPAATSTTPLPVSEQDRLGSIALDQWRGLALVLVLVSHGFFYTNRVNGIGRVGVNLFFFISGILVFRSLSRMRAGSTSEWARTYWWRRLRRLYPALVAYVLAMLPLAWLLQHRPNLSPMSDIGSYLRTMPLALTATINYYDSATWSLGHLWSIACEMQFYLLAPLIFLLGGTAIKRRNLTFGFLLVILLALGLAQPLIGKWKYHFEFAVWPMMLGFCCEYKRDWFLQIPRMLVTLVLWLGVVICCASFCVMVFYPEMKPLVVATGALLLVPCLLAYLFGRPMDKTTGPAMRWLGERTYSIYLWQEPLTICGYLPIALQPVGALASTAVGGAWFHFFERPFLGKNRRVLEEQTSKPKNPGLFKWLVLAFVVVIGAAISALFYLWLQYENRLREQIWPATTPEITVVSSAPADSMPTVLFLGDSRMAQWGLPHLSGWRVVSAGAGGLTTAQIEMETGELLNRYHPNAVVLEAGINDLKYLGLKPDMAPQIVSLAMGNLTAIVKECTARHCKAIVLETWPVGLPSLPRRLVWSERIPASVDTLNAQLRLLNAPESGVRVVDLFGEAGLKISPGLFNDTLHFKPEVYEKLTPVLEKELSAELLVGK
jgi:peptidoglycan/LPS O-acetylase OafA/YrhL/lysophospholipase L1-like esterase